MYQVPKANLLTTIWIIKLNTKIQRYSEKPLEWNCIDRFENNSQFQGIVFIMIMTTQTTNLIIHWQAASTCTRAFISARCLKFKYNNVISGFMFLKSAGLVCCKGLTVNFGWARILRLARPFRILFWKLSQKWATSMLYCS